MALNFDEWDRDRRERGGLDDPGAPVTAVGQPHAVVPGPSVPSPVPPPEDPLDFGTWAMPSYSGPTRPNIKIGPAPQFRAPRFRQPSLADAQNEPGYQFRVGQGTDALERSAAARGVLRTGGTLKDLVEYGQNFAAEEYKNVFDRALQAYGTDYRAAYDEYAPQFSQWQAQSGANQASELASFQRMWDLYQLGVQGAMFQDERIRDLALPSPQSSPDVTY